MIFITNTNKENLATFISQLTTTTLCSAILQHSHIQILHRFILQMETYIKARASTDAKIEDLEKQIDEVVTRLRDKSTKLFNMQASLQARQNAILHTNGGSKASPKDKLTINVGGDQVIVLRETLTQIPGSRLEALFSGRWESRLIRDEEDRIFLDVNPYCFRKIVDYLRLLKVSSDIETDPPALLDISDEHKESFNRLLDFFGLTSNNGPLLSRRQMQETMVY